MRSDEFDYPLPEELIAQQPLAQRDASRLLVLHRKDGHIEHRRFADLIEHLISGDIVVVNDSRVIPARLFGRKTTGGKVEILLLEQVDPHRWRALVGGRHADVGTTISIDGPDGRPGGPIATVTDELGGAQRELAFDRPVHSWLNDFGHTPLPPYIRETLDDPERYQTVYSRPAGSAAAPTAGLHFTADLLLALREKGVLLEKVTLHVGLDTFKPVEAEFLRDHIIHQEWASLSPESASRINEAKLAGGRLVAVGTTAVRTLETAALRSAGVTGSLRDISLRDAAGEATDYCPWKPVAAFEGRTDLFIYPGYRFRAVDIVVTNFHLPRSSLLMLVSAFSSLPMIKTAYQAAVAEKYRFYSFGDAMLIL